MDAFGVARSGLDASMLRLTASASNIANAGVTGPVPGSGAGGSPPYRPVRGEASPPRGGPGQAGLVPADPAYRLTYDPAARDADGRGMVAAPNVDVTDELVETLSVKLAFAANLKVTSTAGDLERRSVDLWG